MSKKESIYKLKVGAPRRFNDPQELIDMFNEYVDFMLKNPITRKESHVKQGIIDVEVPRPLLLESFWHHSNIASSTWYDYKKKEGFSAVITCIEHAIYSQNYDHGIANIYNAKLVASKLGIAEKKQFEANNSTTIIVADKESADNIKKLQDKFNKES